MTTSSQVIRACRDRATPRSDAATRSRRISPRRKCPGRGKELTAAIRTVSVAAAAPLTQFDIARLVRAAHPEKHWAEATVRAACKAAGLLGQIGGKQYNLDRIGWEEREEEKDWWTGDVGYWELAPLLGLTTDDSLDEALGFMPNRAARPEALFDAWKQEIVARRTLDAR